MAEFSDSIVEAFKDTVTVANTFTRITGALGLSGFQFDLVEDESIRLETQITTHYVEDGTPVQDDAVLRPISITVKGKVSEYVDRIAKRESKLQKASRTVGMVAGYLPAISKGAENIVSALNGKSPIDSISTYTNIIDSGVDFYNIFNSITGKQDAQQKAFAYFECLWRARQPLTVKTPYRYFPSMLIKSVMATQPAASRDVSDFVLTLEEHRSVQTATKGLQAAGSSFLEQAKDKIKGVVGKSSVDKRTLSVSKGA